MARRKRSLLQRGAKLRREAIAIGLALKDKRTPWPAKIIAGAAIAYLLSPIDLLPDFIPLVGQLDDLLIVPLGLFLARRMIPAQVLAEARARAQGQTGEEGDDA